MCSLFRFVIHYILRTLLVKLFSMVIQRLPKDRNLTFFMRKVFDLDAWAWQCIHFRALAIHWSSRSWYTNLGERPTQQICLPYLYLIFFHFGIFSSAKRIYIGGLWFYSCGMCILALTKSPACVIIFSWCAGVMYSTLFTMPYLLIAHYHSEGIVRIWAICMNLNF